MCNESKADNCRLEDQMCSFSWVQVLCWCLVYHKFLHLLLLLLLHLSLQQTLLHHPCCLLALLFFFWSTAIFYSCQIWRTREIFFLKPNEPQIPSCFLGQNIIAKNHFKHIFPHIWISVCFFLFFFLNNKNSLPLISIKWRLSQLGWQPFHKSTTAASADLGSVQVYIHVALAKLVTTLL